MSDNSIIYTRRPTRTVFVGQVAVGGNAPIRVQSMTTSDTKDTANLIPEIEALVNAGCEIVRVTVPTQADCDNLPIIRAEMKKRGLKVPLVADIHFTPSIALKSVEFVEKVRINPGNFVDKKLFKVWEYTDQQYQEELSRLHEKFSPLVLKCKEYGIAMRIGTNHGSLSDRIMNRYGDTPAGMVESAMEFLKICEDHDYKNIILSMKASNVQVMIEAYRLLAKRLLETNRDYPFHLGVTEAGFGKEGRVKSAIGIGTLLEEGIGDTIRVSLTEDSVHEVPVAFQLVSKYNSLHALNLGKPDKSYKLPDLQPKTPNPDPVRVWIPSNFSAQEIETYQKSSDGKERPIEGIDQTDIRLQPKNLEEIPSLLDKALLELSKTKTTKIFSVEAFDRVSAYRRLSEELNKRKIQAQIHLRYRELPNENPLLAASIFLGSLLNDGIGQSVEIESSLSLQDTMDLSYDILQGCRLRISKTEYISCPSCGRTQFDLQTTTDKIKNVTSHLKGVKIAVMGCIVNGPGEMADADFGYVGTGPKKVSLYVGKECVERNIPEAEALDRLVSLIKTHNRWVAPSSPL